MQKMFKAVRVKVLYASCLKMNIRKKPVRSRLSADRTSINIVNVSFCCRMRWCGEHTAWDVHKSSRSITTLKWIASTSRGRCVNCHCMVLLQCCSSRVCLLQHLPISYCRRQSLWDWHTQLVFVSLLLASERRAFVIAWSRRLDRQTMLRVMSTVCSAYSVYVSV